MKKMLNYVVKGKKVFIGLEDSKRTWKLCVREGKMIINEISIATNYQNLRSYLINKYPKCTITLMYEAGFGGFWLHDLLEADGFSCIVTPPNKVTVEKCSRVKTDKIDARRLALVLENGDYRACFVPDRERREDRQISRALEQVQKDLTREKNRVRRFFDYHGLNGLKTSPTWSVMEWRRVRTLEVPAALRKTLDVYLSIIDHLQTLKKTLKKDLLELSRKERYTTSFHLLHSVPGIGWLTAIRLVLEWGEDWSRFASAKSIAGFSGLTSSEHSTGDQRHQGRITGESRNTIRGWLIQCAWVSIRKDPVLLDKYKRVLRNSGSKKKAIVAVARKLVVRVRSVLQNKIEYCLGQIA